METWSATKRRSACGIGAAEVGVEGGELFFLRAAAVEGLEVADEEDLERRHQGQGLSAVEDVEDRGVGEVEIVQAELALVGRGELGENAVAAALVEEGFVADQNVAGTHLRRSELGEEAVSGGEAADGRHQ